MAQHFYAPAVTLTASPTAAWSDIQPWFAPPLPVDFMAFQNNDTVDRLVTVQDGNGSVFFSDAVSAGKLWILPIPEGGLVFANGLYWYADVAGKVSAWYRRCGI